MKIPKAPMPFGYWWAMYTDKVKGDAGFKKFEHLFFEPEYGFMTWSLNPDCTILVHPIFSVTRRLVYS